MYTYNREPGKAGLACLSFFAFWGCHILARDSVSNWVYIGVLWACEYAYRAGVCIGDYSVH